MNNFKRIAGTTALAATLLCGVSLFASPAHASYTVTLTERGGNVVANGSGSLDLGALTLWSTGENAFSHASVAGSQGEITAGASSDNNGSFYTFEGSYSPGGPNPNFTGPTSFGTGSLSNASSSGGDLVGYNGNPSDTIPLLVPAGYVSSDPLLSSATWDNATFASLGVTPGSYTWSWGAGTEHPDSFTLDIEAMAVPEPSSLALLALPFGFLLWLTGRRRRTRLAL